MQNIKQLISPKPYPRLQLLIEEQEAKLPTDVETPEVEAPEEERFTWLHKQTYFSLRLVMAVIAILLPVVFLVSAIWVGMQGSISAFYHTDMRNVFVGALFAIGICLYVYKGYNPLENSGLTVAGLFLFGVALFPTTAPEGIIIPWYFHVIHYICAIAFFGLIAVVCIFARRNGFGTSVEFRTAYNITAGLMIFVLAVAGVLFLLDKFLGVGFRTSTFWIEAAAVWVFAGYWCTKSRELRGLG